MRSDPALSALLKLREGELTPHEQKAAYDSIWQLLAWGGIHLARLYEAELNEAEGLVALTCAARTGQYEREAAEQLEQKDEIEMDIASSADLQATAALCALSYANLLAPSEKAIHADRLEQLLEELDAIDPIAADWHRYQRESISEQKLQIPTPTPNMKTKES